MGRRPIRRGNLADPAARTAHQVPPCAASQRRHTAFRQQRHREHLGRVLRRRHRKRLARRPERPRRTEGRRTGGTVMSAPALEARPIASDHYRAVMRHLPTGVAAICSTDPVTGKQNGMIVGTFASLSMEPALVTFSVTHTSTSWPKIAEAERFSVSLLAE